MRVWNPDVDKISSHEFMAAAGIRTFET
jgi:hypothetical protein